MQQKVHNYVVQGPHIFKCYCVYNTLHVNPILSSSQSIFTSTFFLYLLHGEPQPLKNVHEAVQLISRCKEQHPVTTALMNLSASKLLYNQKSHVGLWQEDIRWTTLNKTISVFLPYVMPKYFNLPHFLKILVLLLPNVTIKPPRSNTPVSSQWLFSHARQENINKLCDRLLLNRKPNKDEMSNLQAHTSCVPLDQQWML